MNKNNKEFFFQFLKRIYKLFKSDFLTLKEIDQIKKEVLKGKNIQSILYKHFSKKKIWVCQSKYWGERDIEGVSFIGMQNCLSSRWDEVKKNKWIDLKKIQNNEFRLVLIGSKGNRATTLIFKSVSISSVESSFSAFDARCIWKELEFKLKLRYSRDKDTSYL